MNLDIIKNELIPIYQNFLRRELVLSVVISNEQSACLCDYIRHFFPSYSNVKIATDIDLMFFSPVFENMIKSYG